LIINNQTNVIREEGENQVSRVDAKWHLGKDAIGKLYHQKFKKFLYYLWIQSFIIFNYNICTHKKGRFLQAPRSCNLLYIPIACT